MPAVDLWCGDSLDLMGDIPAGSVDLIAADLPYGTTACKWDTVIPFAPLWAHYRRVLKPRGAVVLTASQPFTSALVMSNPGWFRHETIWDKVGVTGFLDANRKPMKRHESVLVFAEGRTTYNPQMTPGEPYYFNRKSNAEQYGSHVRLSSGSDGGRFPTSIVQFSNANFKERGKVHRTQKPVALFEYLIRTYSNPGDLVLDNTMGSGTTMIACLNTGRRGIGIEKDPEIFQTARRRVNAREAEFSEMLIPA